MRAQKGLVEVSCDFCAKIFRRQASKLRNRKNLFCSHICQGEFIAANSGGRRVLKNGGYVLRSVPAHRQELEHRVIAEKALGKKLPKYAVVHHMDGNKQNNANDNLVICEGRGYHRFLHALKRIADAGGKPGEDNVCWRCKMLKPLEDFNLHKNKVFGRQDCCRQCCSEQNKLNYHVHKGE